MRVVAVVFVSWSACDGGDTTEPLPEPTGDTATTSSPAPTPTGETGTTSPEAPLELCINELMPANATVLADASGAYPDWFELHNPGSVPVGLDGWTVTDGDVAHPLDASLVIEPGGFLVLFADGDVAQGPEHVGFQLAGEGERLGLLAPDGRGSVVEWDALETDLALARVPDCCDGEGCWQAVPRGSPGSTNEGPVLVLERVVAPGARWAWWGQPAAPPVGWEDLGFDDASWDRGPAPLGYGGDEATALPLAPAAALRVGFEVATRPASAVLRLRRDDGVLVLLDGVELVRENLPEGALTPATTATSPIDGAAEVVWVELPLDPAVFRPGHHVLAVTLVQGVPDGDDLLLDAELILGVWGDP